MSDQNKEKQKSIGALWKKSSAKSGRQFFTGKIGDQKIVVFENFNKLNERSPDYQIFESIVPADAKPKSSLDDEIPF